MSGVKQRLADMGMTLPPCPVPIGAYLPVLVADGLVFTSGMLPLVEGDVAVTGAVGAERTLAEGAEAARLCAVNAVAALAAHLGGVAELDRVARIVQVQGHILSAPGFADQPAVLNGASEWLAAVFGETGRHTRLALGAYALPKNATVELALIARVHPA